MDGRTDRRSTFVAERSEIEIEIEILVQLPSFSSSPSLTAAALWSRMSVKRVFRYFSAFSALNMPTMAATPLSTGVDFGYLICAHIFAGIIIVTTVDSNCNCHSLRLWLCLHVNSNLRIFLSWLDGKLSTRWGKSFDLYGVKASLARVNVEGNCARFNRKLKL